MTFVLIAYQGERAFPLSLHASYSEAQAYRDIVARRGLLPALAPKSDPLTPVEYDIEYHRRAQPFGNAE